MKKLLFFSLAVCLFISCNNNKKGIHGIGKDDDNGGGGGGESNWTKKERSQWMDACVNGLPGNPQAKQICSCVLGKIEKKYPSFQEADEKGTEAEGRKMAQQCVAGLTGGIGGGDDDNTGGGDYKGDDYTDDGGGGGNENGWSKTDKNKFMTDCIATTASYQGNGKQLCSCVLEKLEKKYSSLADADRKGVEAARRFTQECMGGGGDDSDNN